MKDRFSFFTEISKVEDLDDGTIKVFGVASSGALDSDGEITNPEAFKAALPEFFRSGPALREMHRPIAAGTVTEAAVDDAGKAQIAAHVVDEGSIKKVKAGVLRGFSWSGPILKRRAGAPNILDKIQINEISLVDRPANPEAKIEVWKAEKSPVARVAKKGLWDVARIAELLADLAWLQSCAADEAFWEGDASDVPAKLRDNVNGLADTLQEMLGEEIAELAATMNAKTITGDDAMKIGTKENRAAFSAFLLKYKDEAAKALGIAPDKLDAAVKSATDEDDRLEIALKAAQKGMADLHAKAQKHVDAIGEAHKSAIGFAAKCEDLMDGEDEGKKADRAKARDKKAIDEGATIGDLAAKLAKAEGEKTALVTAHATQIAEKDDAIKALKDAGDELVSRMRAKGILKTVTLDKIDDVTATGDDAAKKKKDDAPTDALAEIRAAHKDGEKLQRA